MTIPDFQTLMLPVLRIAGDGQTHAVADVVDQVADEFQLTPDERAETLANGGTRIGSRVSWSVTYLKKAGLLKAAGRGLFTVTDVGRQVLNEAPPTIGVRWLEERFPELAAFTRGAGRDADGESRAVYDDTAGEWDLRPGVEEKVKATIERYIPDQEIRHNALRFFAAVVEMADQERHDSWYVRITDRGVRLMAGRLVACELSRSTLNVGILGPPLSDESRERLGSDPDSDGTFKSIPGSLFIRFPAHNADHAIDILMDDLRGFIEASMEKVRRAVDLEYHAPEAVLYVANLVGTELPQPVPSAPQESEREGEEDEAVRQPRERGRPPIFELGQRSIASLVSDIEREAIALPDLQRPFVWEDSGAQQLLDSLFLGFPVGTLVFWNVAEEKNTRAIGAQRPGLNASTLVIDGQQRLTSLFAVIKGVAVVGKNGAPRKIEIAFRPRDGRFEVADAAIRNDPEFLPNVTELWDGRRMLPQIRRDLINRLRDAGRVVDDAYEVAAEYNLARAHAITDFRFPTVEIRKTANSKNEVTDEDVAEIFVRLNNQGTRLGQADFVLTLLSVFHGPLRDMLETRSREMSDGAVVPVDTQQLLRAACAVAFGRARMAAIYRYLRGVDPITGDTNADDRIQRLDQLDEAAAACVQPTPWRDYQLRVKRAGFVNPKLVASRAAVVNGYAFYVLGKRRGVEKNRLDELVSRWVFGTLLTQRYSASSETVFEQDLARIRDANAEGFERAIDDALRDQLTGDYWTQTLPAALETDRTRAPSSLAFAAAQLVLGARALFSDQPLRDMLDSTIKATRSAAETHHLFPVAYLKALGMVDKRSANQVANLADVGWHDNVTIGAKRPSDYVPRIRDRLRISDDQWGRMCAEHALPPKWETMEYRDFLRERRRRMADMVRVAYRQLGGEPDAPPITPPWFMPGTESVWRKISEVERTLRRVVREVFVARFSDAAAAKLQELLSESERETLGRALRSQAADAPPLGMVDFLYLGQLTKLLFANEVWQESRKHFQDQPDLKRVLDSALRHIAPVRNEIAHVREVDENRLQRADLACQDVLALVIR